MSRSRNHGRSRRPDPDRRRERAATRALPLELLIGELEYVDHASRGGLCYWRAWADLRAEIDAATSHHRGRRATGRERAYRKGRRLLERQRRDFDVVFTVRWPVSFLDGI